MRKNLNKTLTNKHLKVINNSKNIYFKILSWEKTCHSYATISSPIPLESRDIIIFPNSFQTLYCRFLNKTVFK
jgi:hypothetical protein